MLGSVFAALSEQSKRALSVAKDDLAEFATAVSEETRDAWSTVAAGHRETWATPWNSLSAIASSALQIASFDEHETAAENPSEPTAKDEANAPRTTKPFVLPIGKLGSATRELGKWIWDGLVEDIDDAYKSKESELAELPTATFMTTDHSKSDSWERFVKSNGRICELDETGSNTKLAMLFRSLVPDKMAQSDFVQRLGYWKFVRREEADSKAHDPPCAGSNDGWVDWDEDLEENPNTSVHVAAQPCDALKAASSAETISDNQAREMSDSQLDKEPKASLSARTEKRHHQSSSARDGNASLEGEATEANVPSALAESLNMPPSIPHGSSQKEFDWD